MTKTLTYRKTDLSPIKLLESALHHPLKNIKTSIEGKRHLTALPTGSRGDHFVINHSNSLIFGFDSNDDQSSIDQQSVGVFKFGQENLTESRKSSVEIGSIADIGGYICDQSKNSIMNKFKLRIPTNTRNQEAIQNFRKAILIAANVRNDPDAQPQESLISNLKGDKSIELV